MGFADEVTFKEISSRWCTIFRGENRHTNSVITIFIAKKSLRATGLIPTPLVKHKATDDLIASGGPTKIVPLVSLKQRANCLNTVVAELTGKVKYKNTLRVL